MAQLPSAEGGAEEEPAVPRHTEILGAAGHLELHLHPPTQRQHHTYMIAGGERFCGAEREMAGRIFSRVSGFPSGFTSCPPPGWKSAPYAIEKFSLQVFKQTSYFLNVRVINYRGSHVSAGINLALLYKGHVSS